MTSSFSPMQSRNQGSSWLTGYISLVYIVIATLHYEEKTNNPLEKIIEKNNLYTKKNFSK